MVTALMLDIHSELAILSCEFQKATLVFSEVQTQIDGTVNKLDKLSSADGSCVTDMKARIQVENGVAKYNNNDELMYKVTMPDEFERLKGCYIDRLKKIIRGRLRKEDGDIFTDLSNVLEPSTVNCTPCDERANAVASLGQFYGYEK
ncbi:hypothetical protein DPMN_037278 [Dreissena polymorpha]|uniref:Uncharacterized protein n=1 Tax=Dreissena polymorpha TaxID=45954 RepID=A0A9D4RPP0_DREPO|nr:hypothetical protein DPMN_037278 [Dreissena polymorpha]